ncbi:hypothetical protein P7C70_g2011, partial [Phenoliferia sp. Uapishka_3]
MTDFKAWSYTTPPFPSTFKLVPVTPPEKLEPTQLLIEVHAASLNPVDVQLANASIFKLSAMSNSTSVKKYLGSPSQLFVPVIHSQNPFYYKADESVKLGKPMETCLSEVLLTDTKKAVILPKPSTLSHTSAAAIPLVFLTALTTLSPPYTVLPTPDNSSPSTSNDTPTTPGFPKTPTIVILGGSSAVGIFAIQLAVKIYRARVITTCSERNIEFVKGLGAEVVLDYTRENVRDRLLSLRPSEGYGTKPIDPYSAAQSST